MPARFVIPCCVFEIYEEKIAPPSACRVPGGAIPNQLLTDFLLMPQLPQPFLTLMRCHLMTFTLFTAWHGAPPLVGEKIGLIRMISYKTLGSLSRASVRV